jgi:hypothetical protein
MAHAPQGSTKLDRVLVMFPGRKRAIMRLFLSDPVFRSLSEDMCEAHDSLARLQRLSPIGERPEVVEYRSIIAELEAEVRAYVEARGPF